MLIRFHKIFVFFFIVLTHNVSGQVPSFEWVKKIPFEIVGQCTDSADNVYISGMFQGTLHFENMTLTSDQQSYDILIAKFDSTGNLQWCKQYGGGEYDGAADLKIDHDNNLLVLNYFNKWTVYYGDTIVAGMNIHGGIFFKLSDEGDLIWRKQPGYNDNGCFHVLTSSIDQDNNILVMGNIEWGNGIFQDTTIAVGAWQTRYFIAKYDNDGDFIWVKTFQDEIKQCSIDDSNNILVITDTIGKYDSDGNLCWGKKFNPVSASNNYSKVSFDSSGNIYIVASFQDTLLIDTYTFVSTGYTDIVLVKLHPDGNISWIQTFGGRYSNVPNAIFINHNHLILTGTFNDVIYLGNDSLNTVTLYSSNAFVSGFDLDGNLKFAKKLTCAQSSSLKSISGFKAIYLGGTGTDFTYFDNIIVNLDQIPNVNEYFLARLNWLVVNSTEEENSMNSAPFNICPNPSDQYVFIDLMLAPENVFVEIFDAQGRLRIRASINQFHNCIEVGNLSKGIYFVKIEADHVQSSSSFIKL